MTQILAGERPQLPETVWRLSAPPLVPCPKLEGRKEVDVAIIGGGFTGQMAAITLREAGRSVAVIDAVEPGWGASGRNNGQVIPGFKWDPDEIVQRYGPDSEALVAWGGAAPRLVFDTIARYGIDCSPVQKGWIQPAYTDIGAARIKSRCEQWARRGAPVEMLETTKLPEILGTPIFQSGWIDRRGGSINPLAYARGLAKAAIELGAAVHANTTATALRRDGAKWVPAGKLARLADAYVEVLRSIPLIVQMFLWFYVAPDLLPDAAASVVKAWDRYNVVAAILCLGLFTSARIAEQVRAGIQSIPTGQSNAAKAMGMETAQAYRYVLLPVAFRRVIPALTNEFVNIIKNTSVAFTIAVIELMAATRTMQEMTFQPFEAFTAATVIYLAVNLTAVKVMSMIEKSTRIPGYGQSH